MKKNLIISIVLIVLSNNLAYSQDAIEAKKVKKPETKENFKNDNLFSEENK